MNFFVYKLLIPFTLIFLFSDSAFPADLWNFKNVKKNHHYIDDYQVGFIISEKYTSYINNSLQDHVSKNNISPSFNNSYQDYTDRKPFDGANLILSSSTTSSDDTQNTMMRASNSTNDDELPGDPGQMPLADGLWFLLCSVGVYTVFKKLKTLTR